MPKKGPYQKYMGSVILQFVHQKNKAPERVKRDPHLFELFLAILQIVKDNVVKMTRVQKCLAIQNI
jgi:hypothetical protein